MALEQESSIAWFCTYTPLEILDAAGLVPIRRFGDPHILESADTLLHPAICPYARSCLADELRQDGPHHALFINSCDAMRRLYDTWRSRFADDFVYLMDLPRSGGAWGEKLLVEEFRLLIMALEEALEREISAEELRRASRAREEERLAFLTSAEGTCGEERLRMAMDIHTNHARKRHHPEKRIKDGSTGTPVLLTGNLLNPSGIVAYLEKAGARAVWIDLCNGDRCFSSSTLAEGEDIEELLASMASKYLQRHPCARMSDSQRRYDLLVEKSHEVGARGVIYASLKFCDSYLYDFPRVQGRLKREGIPVLRLESDYIDGHLGQLLTRVEAFLEMI